MEKNEKSVATLIDHKTTRVQDDKNYGVEINADGEKVVFCLLCVGSIGDEPAFSLVSLQERKRNGVPKTTLGNMGSPTSPQTTKQRLVEVMEREFRGDIDVKFYEFPTPKDLLRWAIEETPDHFAEAPNKTMSESAN